MACRFEAERDTCSGASESSSEEDICAATRDPREGIWLWARVLRLIRWLKVELGSGVKLLLRRRSSSPSPLLDNSPEYHFKAIAKPSTGNALFCAPAIVDSKVRIHSSVLSMLPLTPQPLSRELRTAPRSRISRKAPCTNLRNRNFILRRITPNEPQESLTASFPLYDF